MVPLANVMSGKYATPSPRASLIRTPFFAPSLKLLRLRLKTWKPFFSAIAKRSGWLVFCWTAPLEVSESPARPANVEMTKSRLFMILLQDLCQDLRKANNSFALSWRAKQGDQAIGNGAAPTQSIVAAVVFGIRDRVTARRQRVAHAPVFQHHIDEHALFQRADFEIKP